MYDSDDIEALFRDDDDISIVSGSINSTINQHTFDGTVCPICEIIHNESSSENVDELTAEFNNIFSQMPEEVASKIKGAINSIENKESEVKTFESKLAYVTDSFSYMRDLSEVFPSLRALHETLDEMTDGLFSRRTSKYFFEANILGSGLVNQLFHVIHENYENRVKAGDTSSRVLNAIESLVKLKAETGEKLDILIQEYVSWCSENGMDPDSNVCSLILADDRHMSDLSVLDEPYNESYDFRAFSATNPTENYTPISLTVAARRILAFYKQYS